MKIFTYTCIAAVLIYSLPIASMTLAQDTINESSEVTTAILDTSIPFAIGAREGEQTIRSSFGWPTFQEGFVENVYFRFDPDGYARFSSSPRLDEDVFEVICQNASTVCIAKKGGLEISLTAQGTPRLHINGIIPTDKFFISDRKNELPLPDALLQTIDQRLEALLSSGGDLIIRRELETLQTLSLSGFLATVTYLRWVAQNQASFIFPRGWPIPSQQINSKTKRTTLQDKWHNINSQNKISPINNNRQEPRMAVQQNQNWPNRNNRYGTTSALKTSTNNFDTSGIGFAQQARGRSLPADVNRFEALPSQKDYPQLVQPSSPNLQTNPETLELELNLINRSLRNLELKIDNLSARLSYELRSSRINLSDQKQSGGNTYEGINQTNNTFGNQSAGPSKETQLRKRMIESILQNPQQNSAAQPTPSQSLKNGEVSIKKNIVERLLEELNSSSQIESNAKELKTENTGEFISLSDYISKVMQAEQRN